MLALAGCKQAPSKLDRVIAPGTTIALDGELDEAAWNDRAVRGVFSTDGELARPYSEVRLLRDETHLVVGLYAADEDIRSDDTFRLTAGTFVATFTAAGTATPATVRAAVDRDGTLDDAHDDDEEWVVEAAIPLAELAPGPLAFVAERCDRTKDGARHCGSWHGTIEPAKLPSIR